MLKLKVIQNEITYYGFFVDPAFDLMGDIRSLMRLLYETFSGYGASLSSFKLEDSQEVSATTVYVRLGLRGIYKFKFDQAQAALSDFTDEQLGGFVEMLQTSDEHLRDSISNLKYRTHAFFYNSHCESSSKSTDFLRSLAGDKGIAPLGEDLGSGVLLNWHDPNMNANVSFTVDHSLQVKNGLFVSYRVLINADRIDYTPLVVHFYNVLNETLAMLGLEFDEEVRA